MLKSEPTSENDTVGAEIILLRKRAKPKAEMEAVPRLYRDNQRKLCFAFDDEDNGFVHMALLVEVAEAARKAETKLAEELLPTFRALLAEHLTETKAEE